MVSAARDRLASMLRGDLKSASSVQFTAKPDELRVEIDGFGAVRFPVTPAKARKLIDLARPARFGRGEETVTDADVRDTWEVPKELVRPTWNEPVLHDILATIKEELGLPNGAELTADLHSLLVYEKDQFFLTHQDSEKDDAMVGTLVVTLPSTYAGGELKVGHNEEWTTYHSSRRELSLVAFYADCQHEVLPVKSGYRITLTYNLLLHGDTSRPDGEEGKVAEVTSLLREHFASPARRYAYAEPELPPNRLVYLLDHEYTPRSLSWTRLKGADAARVSLLRTAAEQAGYEAILGLADVKTSHGAYPEERGYGYRRRRDWDADYTDDEGYADYQEGDYDFSRRTLSDTREFQIQDLLYSEVTLTHWTGPDGRRLEETSLHVSDGEVCASTEDGDVAPYAAEYEGYMGNWGNTLDRWYHRAAIVMWPRSEAFANRAETSPAWALDELISMAAAGHVSEAIDAAMTLERFWSGRVRGLTAPENGSAGALLEKTLRAATAIADGEVATMLLRPFRVELLDETNVGVFAAAANHYGHEWTTNLVRGWFGETKSVWAFADPGRLPWLGDGLLGLTRALDAAGGEAAAAARLLVDLSWAWLATRIDEAIAVPSPSRRDSMLDGLGKPLAAVLTTAATLAAANVLDTVCAHATRQPDVVTVLERSALRAAAVSWRGKGPSSRTPGRQAWAELAADCSARLRARLERPQRAGDDWSIRLPEGCTCNLCGALAKFLSQRDHRVLEWPLAEQGRRHIHERIDRAELPVTHQTRRAGRPYTLVLTKTDDLFTRERDTRDAADADLKWLAARGLL